MTNDLWQSAKKCENVWYQNDWLNWGHIGRPKIARPKKFKKLNFYFFDQVSKNWNGFGAPQG